MKNRNLLSMIAASATLAFSMGVSAQALYVTPSGDVGVGTDAPLSSLEVTRSDGTAQILVTETNASQGPRSLFEIQNNGNPEFRMTNSGNGNSWLFSAGLRFVVKNNLGDWVSRVNANGDMEITGVLTEGSDVNSKQDIEPVDGQNILEKLTNLEISEWSYKDAPADRHVGPMAQDFYAAFGLGHTDKGIATLDSSGVALAAIKALIDENASLKERLSLLESQQAEMQAVMAEVLENQHEQRVLTNTVMN